MDKVFKKKSDIPPPPSLPTPTQIVDDLKAAAADDPVFYGTSINLQSTKGDDKDFRVAKDFMTTTTKLKELEKVLVLRKVDLEESFKELEIMSDNIRQQATEALSSVY